MCKLAISKASHNVGIFVALISYKSLSLVNHIQRDSTYLYGDSQTPANQELMYITTMAEVAYHGKLSGLMLSSTSRKSRADENIGDPD